MVDTENHTIFRLLLGFGALVCLLGGVAGILGVRALGGFLGIEIDEGSVTMVRLFGAFAGAFGVGYVLAAIDPVRQRGLLAALLAAPLLVAIALLIGVARDEMARPVGGALAAVSIAYLLVYVRLYPRGGTGPKLSRSA